MPIYSVTVQVFDADLLAKEEDQSPPNTFLVVADRVEDREDGRRYWLKNDREVCRISRESLLHQAEVPAISQPFIPA